MHLTLIESWKPCLSLWEHKWLRLKQSLVRSSILFELWQLKTLFVDCLIKCKIEFLKLPQLSEFLNFDVKVIPFINGRWDEEIFEKIMFHTSEKKISHCLGSKWRSFCWNQFGKITWSVAFKSFIESSASVLKIDS